MLLDLTLLAPDVQAEILEMVAVDGREPIAEGRDPGKVGAGAMLL